MAWSLKSQPYTVPITKALATEWAAMEAAHTDRPLQERRLRRHERTLAQGKFRPVNWAKVYVKSRKKWIKVNAKHTATVFAKADLTKAQPLFAQIEEYVCDTMEDVADLYETFDSREQMRTTSDVNRAFAAVTEGLESFDLRTVNLLVAGLSYAMWPSREGRPETITAGDRAKLLGKYKEFCLWYNTLFPYNEENYPLRRAPVVAATFRCYEKDKDAAETFWTEVRDETGRQPHFPSRKLAKFLSTHRGEQAGNRIAKRYRVTAREFYAKCVIAWNAWRARKPTDLKYKAAAPLPEVV